MIKGQKNPNARRKCRGCRAWMRWGGSNLAWGGYISLETRLERAEPPLDHLCVKCAEDPPVTAEGIHIAQLDLFAEKEPS